MSFVRTTRRFVDLGRPLLVTPPEENVLARLEGRVCLYSTQEFDIISRHETSPVFFVMLRVIAVF